MSHYDEFLAARIQYAEDNRHLIDRVNKTSDIAFPQHILMAKELCKELETCRAVTGRLTTGQFGFSERLVNKLMLLAFLKGREDIDSTSFKQGWDACMEDVLLRLNGKDG